MITNKNYFSELGFNDTTFKCGVQFDVIKKTYLKYLFFVGVNSNLIKNIKLYKDGEELFLMNKPFNTVEATTVNTSSDFETNRIAGDYLYSYLITKLYKGKYKIEYEFIKSNNVPIYAFLNEKFIYDLGLISIDTDKLDYTINHKENYLGQKISIDKNNFKNVASFYYEVWKNSKLIDVRINIPKINLIDVLLSTRFPEGLSYDPYPVPSYSDYKAAYQIPIIPYNDILYYKTYSDTGYFNYAIGFPSYLDTTSIDLITNKESFPTLVMNELETNSEILTNNQNINLAPNYLTFEFEGTAPGGLAIEKILIPLA